MNKAVFLLKNILQIPSRLINRQALNVLIRDSNLSKKVKVLSGGRVYWSTINDYSYIGNNTRVFNTSIGKYCSIGEKCLIGAPEHDLNYISTSPVFFSGKNIFRENFTNMEPKSYRSQTIIEHDVWIGANCMIKQGVKIGQGSVIGMGSVLTHDVPDYEIWAGNPAKKIRDRFPDSVKADLLSVSWPDLSDLEIKTLLNKTNTIEEFTHEIRGGK
ncbi:CatB-related O-acetyltransferase [Enterococcus mundtii]|uniref:CatB-related O-acetyltransferase n=1 Tax=Enterococcus TaxID=1350 RepID=UPI000D35BA9F|nr:CatB-related O-acetyltransferase [Enterococcus mundtii]PTO35903.1 antibiotic acetyltransferase [Enterococcus mundtii]